MAQFERKFNFASQEKNALSWIATHGYEPTASLEWNTKRLLGQLVGPYKGTFFTTRGYGSFIRGGSEQTNQAFSLLASFVTTYRNRHPDWQTAGGHVETVNFHGLDPDVFPDERTPEAQTARRMRQVMQRRLFGIAVNTDGVAEDWHFRGDPPFTAPTRDGAWAIDTTDGWAAEPAYENADMAACGLVRPHGAPAQFPLLSQHVRTLANGDANPHYRPARTLSFDQYDDLDMQTAALLKTYYQQERLGLRELPAFAALERIHVVISEFPTFLICRALRQHDTYASTPSPSSQASGTGIFVHHCSTQHGAHFLSARTAGLRLVRR